MSEQSEELVWLTVGPEYDDGELVARGDAPNDAFKTALTIAGEDATGGRPGQTYEVWAIER